MTRSRRYHPSPASIGATPFAAAMVVMATVGWSTPASAADECRVKYEYGLSQTSGSRAVSENDTESVEQSNVLWVKNDKSHPVEIQVTTLSGGTKWVTLAKLGDRDPSPNNYVGSITLMKVKCPAGSGSSSIGPQFSTPQAMLDGLKAAGQTAGMIASQLQAAFNQDAGQVANLLQDAGYSAATVAGAVKSAFPSASVVTVGTALKNAGFTVAQVAAGLGSAFSATGLQLGGWFEDLGYTASQTVDALRLQFQPPIETAAGWLKSSGFGTGAIAQALWTSYGPTPANLAASLKNAGYTLNQAAEALESINLQPGQIAAALATGFGASGQLVMAALKQAGMTAAQAGAAVQSAFNVPGAQLVAWFEAAGFTAADAVRYLRGIGEFNCGAAGCPSAMVLRAGNYRIDEAATAFRQVYGFGADVTGKILRDAYGASAAVITAALEAAGYLRDQVLAAQAAYSDVYYENAQRGSDAFAAARIEIKAMMHGEHLDCRYPNLRRYDPLPIPPGRTVRVTLWGTIGAPVAVYGYGGWRTIRQTACGVLAEVTLPASVEIGSPFRGELKTMAGGVAASFNWIAGSPMQETPVTVVTPPITTRPSTPNALPDLAPVALSGGPVFRFSQPNSRRIADQFCQSLPVAGAGEAPTAVITLAPAIGWSVTNTGTGPAAGAFVAELRNNANQAVLQAATINGLAVGEMRTMQYSRPQMQTRVLRVTPQSTQQTITLYGGAGCFQAIMPAGDPMDWRDPLFRVVVDVNGAVSEGGGGDANNAVVY